MIDLESRLLKVESELAAIREKVSFFSVIYEKFDKTLDKLDERTIEDRKEINEMMNTMRISIMDEIKALRVDMASQHEVEKKKIEDLNKWRWVVMGAAAVIGWVLSRFTVPLK